MVFFRVWYLLEFLHWFESNSLNCFFFWTTRCVQEGFAHPTELAGEGARGPRTSWDRALAARAISTAECSQSWASAAVQSVHHCLRKVLLRRYQQQQLIPLGLTKMLIKNSVFKGHIYLSYNIFLWVVMQSDLSPWLNWLSVCWISSSLNLLEVLKTRIDCKLYMTNCLAHVFCPSTVLNFDP